MRSSRWSSSRCWRDRSRCQRVLRRRRESTPCRQGGSILCCQRQSPRESPASPECPALPPEKENPVPQLPPESSAPQLSSERESCTARERVSRAAQEKVPHTASESTPAADSDRLHSDVSKRVPPASRCPALPESPVQEC
ncbi:UNVERIFIED_CONTAM: hypothetical protein FKN15_025581 [Acipenser sinensis]